MFRAHFHVVAAPMPYAAISYSAMHGGKLNRTEFPLTMSFTELFNASLYKCIAGLVRLARIRRSG